MLVVVCAGGRVVAGARVVVGRCVEGGVVVDESPAVGIPADAQPVSATTIAITSGGPLIETT